MFTDPFALGGGSIFPAELVVFISAAVIVGVIAVLVAGRLDEDQARARPIARYLGAIGLFTLFVTLFSAFGAVHAMTDLVVDHQARFDEYEAYATDEFLPIEGESTFIPGVGYNLYDFSSETTNDGNYAVALASGLIALTSGAVFMVHARWRRRLMEGKSGGSEVALRVDRAYHLGRCFVAALVAASGLVAVGYGLFEIIAPGVAVGGNADVTRAEGISEMLAFSVLTVASSLIFIRSWRQVSPDLGPAS